MRTSRWFLTIVENRYTGTVWYGRQVRAQYNNCQDACLGNETQVHMKQRKQNRTEQYIPVRIVSQCIRIQPQQRGGHSRARSAGWAQPPQRRTAQYQYLQFRAYSIEMLAKLLLKQLVDQLKNIQTMTGTQRTRNQPSGNPSLLLIHDMSRTCTSKNIAITASGSAEASSYYDRHTANKNEEANRLSPLSNTTR